MSDTPTNTQDHACLAINLQHECVLMKIRRESLRAQASALRKQAKATKVKSDAFAMRKTAKPMSDEAQELKSKLIKAGKDFLTHAEQAHALLTKRMPDGWCQWGVVKTRAYTSCLAIISVQIARIHPCPVVIAATLQNLVNHESWSAHTMQLLATTKAHAKEIPTSN